MLLTWGGKASWINRFVPAPRQVGIGGYVWKPLAIEVGAAVGADAAPGTKLMERRGCWEGDSGAANLAGSRETDVWKMLVYVVSLGALV